MTAQETPRPLASMVGPHGRVLEIAPTGEKPGEVTLQWFFVDLEGDAHQEKGEKLTVNLWDLPGLIHALERAVDTAQSAGLSLDPPPPPPLPSPGGPR